MFNIINWHKAIKLFESAVHFVIRCCAEPPFIRLFYDSYSEVYISSKKLYCYIFRFESHFFYLISRQGNLYVASWVLNRHLCVSSPSSLASACIQMKTWIHKTREHLTLGQKKQKNKKTPQNSSKGSPVAKYFITGEILPHLESKQNKTKQKQTKQNFID